MTQPMYQNVPVACPACQFRFSAPILTIIDVGLQPQAKEQLLSGRLNIAVCPQCGRAGMLGVPLVYHDPQKELLFTFLPPDLSASETDKQQAIGDLTNQVISSLPSEGRKAYLLQPRSFLTLESMLEAVLGPNKAIVRLTAELDWEKVDRTIETVDAENPAIVSEQVTSGTNPDGSSSESSTTNYEFSKRMERPVSICGSNIL